MCAIAVQCISAFSVSNCFSASIKHDEREAKQRVFTHTLNVHKNYINRHNDRRKSEEAVDVQTPK